MTNMAVSGVNAAVTATAGEPAAGAQPSAQAVARFEQQLQAPPTVSLSYASPFNQVQATHGAWQSVMSDVGQLSEDYRVGSTTLFEPSQGGVEDMPLGHNSHANLTSSVEGFRHEMSQVTHLTFTMMNINLVTTAERVAGENVRSLFQLS